MIAQIRAKVIRQASRLAERSFHVVHHQEARGLEERRRACNQEVYVYQMGKVGSSAIVKALREAAPLVQVHHVHRASIHTLEPFADYVRGAFRQPLVKGRARRRLVRQVISANRLNRLVSQPVDGPPLKVISPVREPVARNISAFFEVLPLLLNYDLNSRLTAAGLDGVVDELTHLFLTGDFDHDLPLTFFDREIEATLGIDVFQGHFDFDRRLQEETRDGLELLVIRMEDLDSVGEDHIRNFLGIPGIRLARANVGEKKRYADAYSRFKRQIRLPESYLDRMYSSQFARHFYSAAEIERFREGWSQGRRG